MKDSTYASPFPERLADRAVVMTNSQSGVEITRPIVELIAQEYGWALPE